MWKVYSIINDPGAKVQLGGGVGTGWNYFPLYVKTPGAIVQLGRKNTPTK